MPELGPSELRHFTRRLKTLENERKKGWESHWRELAGHFLPRRSRFLDAGEQTNEDARKNDLEDSIGVMSLRTLANGMQSGLTSPARPWFSLTLQDRDLAETADAKFWLHDTYEKIAAVFGKSNFYDQIHILYHELACFGTGVMIIESDAETTIRCRCLTAGEYAVDAGANGVVDTLYRRVRMTARQILQQWPDACPDPVKLMAEHDNPHWLTVLHAVEPRRDSGKEEARKAADRPWRSVYMILEGAKQECLEDSGYYEFPALCPRWITTASDVYGASPAMDALGDCAQLQKITFDLRAALELEVNPPLLAQKGLVSGEMNLSPGFVNYTSGMMQSGDVVRPLITARANLQGGESTRAQIKQQIQKHFFNDLFLMISDINKQMTATEVAERNAEKLLMLGPVLDRLRSELFQPLVERTYGIMDRAGMIAFPPDSLVRKEIKVEFISILAQAQRQAGIAALTKTVGFAMQLAQANPEIIDRINFDEVIDQFADMQGTEPSVIRSMEEIKGIREQRRQQQQMAQQMALMRQGAEIAKTGAGAVKDFGASGVETAQAEGGTGL